jgi:hypothetical protein
MGTRQATPPEVQGPHASWKLRWEGLMATTVTVRDESTSGKMLNEFVLDLLTEHITVRELIRSRVYQEVQDYNRRLPESVRGLVQPNDSEETVDGFKLKKPREIEWKAQFDRALEAFESNRVLILVNDRQVESLDEKIVVSPNTSISFLKLTMLVGG